MITHDKDNIQPGCTVKIMHSSRLHKEAIVLDKIYPGYEGREGDNRVYVVQFDDGHEDGYSLAWLEFVRDNIDDVDSYRERSRYATKKKK